MVIASIGVFLFGLVVGWVAYRTLRIRAGVYMLSELATILEVGGSALVIALLRNDALFGWYGLGLALGFFVYLTIGLRLSGLHEVQPWQSLPPTPSAPPPAPPQKDEESA